MRCAVLRSSLLLVALRRALIVAPTLILCLGNSALAQDTAAEREWFSHTERWLEGEKEILISAKRGELSEEAKREALRKVIIENLEKSYITFGGGARFSGDETRENLYFEGQLFVNLSFLEWEKKRIWVDLPIRIAVRMYDSRSRPIRTPSFVPGIRVIQDLGSERLSDLTYWSIGLHHFSNGQDGETVDQNGNLNVDSGSFSTNYLELALYKGLTGKPIQWARLGWRYHFSRSEEGLRDQYETANLSLSLRTKELKLFGQPTYLTYTGTYSYAGRDYVVRNEVDASKNVKADSGDNLHTTLELTVLPKSWNWKNVALYARYDYGYDYYNVHFQNRVNRLQLGVASTNF